MSAPITITATVAAWLPSYSKPNDLLAYLERGDNSKAVGCLQFYGPTNRESFSDYIRIGEADITVRLIPRDEQVLLAVRSLQKKLDDARAQWLTRQQEIMTEISKIQALTYEVEA